MSLNRVHLQGFLMTRSPAKIQSPLNNTFIPTTSLSGNKQNVVIIINLLIKTLQLTCITVTADNPSFSVLMSMGRWPVDRWGGQKQNRLLQISSVLWRCWLGGRKGIRLVRNWVVGCWHGYLSAARCRLAYGPADTTATYCLLLQ